MNTLDILRRELPMWTTAPIVRAPTLRSTDCVLASGDDGERSDDADAQRDELLQRSRQGEHIELMLDATPFIQHPTEHNTNHVRFRSLPAMGRSGVNSVFLRDHRQRDLDMRGGTVEKSKMEKGADGSYYLRQSIRLHEPWAVQKALTGSIDRFSIGWYATGRVTCSQCKTDILSECWHFPGDSVTVGDSEVVVEWVYHKVDLIETSAVSIPAVRGTTVHDIRLALSPYLANRPHLHRTRRTQPMSLKRICARLGLADGTGEDDVLAAIDALSTKHSESTTKLAAVSAQLDEARDALATERAAHEALRTSLAQRDEDEFIAAGIEAGKIRPGSKFEGAMRKLYAMDADAAKEQLDAAQVITPVGKPRQSDDPPALDSDLDELTYQQLKNAGITDPHAYYAEHGQR